MILITSSLSISPVDLNNSVQCPDYKPLTYSTLERFFELEKFENRRQSAGVEGIQVSQITVMADSIQGHSAICSSITSSTDLGGRINEKIHPDYNIKAWDTTYYYYSGVQGTFYFAVQRPARVEGWFNTGISGVLIFDENLNHIGGGVRI
jgi:hypothetical protein